MPATGLDGMKVSLLLLAAAAVVMAGCAGQDQAAAPDNGTEPAEAPTPQQAREEARSAVVSPLEDEPDIRAFLESGDRLLFLGDGVTQQMFYTQATASALLSLMPDQDLRMFNGGRAGSSAADAVDWAPDLLSMTQPTVVFVLFGLEEGLTGRDDPEAALAQYRDGLQRLLAVINEHESVRQVIVAGPLPAATLATEVGPPEGVNALLGQMAETSVTVAGEQQVGYVNLFEFMRQVYIAGNVGDGARMTFENGLPTEEGHVVIASVLLAAMGVTAEDLEAIGWSPLPPRRMYRVRQVLAIPASAPEEAQAARSRALYSALAVHHERFFRAWRLAGRGEPGPQRRRALAHADEAWRQVQRLARSYFDPTVTPAQAPAQPLEVPPHPAADPDEDGDDDTGQAPEAPQEPQQPHAPQWHR